MLSDSTIVVQQNLAMPTSTSSTGAGSPNEAGSSVKGANNFPAPKTDKPRPHVCGTCQRSFARLEHLKRHERSHTKEKPFECPECTRCFARRDLLLRHQQKLHMTTTPSSRPRNRRESTASTATNGPGRVRKNSVATTGANTMRPRANTISHIDGASMNMMAATNAIQARQGVSGSNHGHSRHGSLIGLPMHDYQFGGMSHAMGQRGVNHGLPKLETNSFNNVDFSGGLRTAPPIGGFNNEFDFEGLLFGPGSTVNPNALHYSDSPQSMAVDTASYYQDMSASQTLDENFEWMNGFEHQMNFSNENAIENSSPSAMSSASPGGVSEVMVDGSNNPANSAAMWQQSMMAPPLMTPSFSLDVQGNGGFPDLFNGGPMSPHALPPKNPNDPYFSTPPPSMSSLSPSMMHGLNTQGLQQAMNFGPETPSSINGSLPNTPVSTITENTRQALVMALAQCQPFGSRKYSFPAVSSPLSPHFNNRPSNVSDASRNLPSTQDFQRYIGAYIRYFQPHLPFLHLPTLSFDVPTQQGRSQSSTVSGRGCLILSMAAIGALYEMEQTISKELFDSAKKMIQLYLEERRKADVRKADMRKAGVHDPTQSNGDGQIHTPVWLVQAMLLNVVYGHNCGDKVAGDIASTHCAALVSLSRAAELLRPAHIPGQDAPMTDDDHNDGWNIKQEGSDEHSEWIRWKFAEERKRTLYGVFILSSLLVSAYNHTPALTNSEILLDLPCDEDFWTADNSQSFHAKGGVIMANHNRMTFHDALGELLRTSEKQQQQQQQMHPQQGFGSSHIYELPQSDLKPSTFGCLVLINALHNYIWETRQRHHNKIWTNEETEKMHRHIEPALKAWQAAWASNPQHSLERPNPFGLGPLSSDSIPLLDLAYVRLFVNLSRSKEKFWQRDWDGMAEELSRGSEIIQHAEHSPTSNQESNSDPSESSTPPTTSTGSPDFVNVNMAKAVQHSGTNQTGGTSKRERHLRKAAFYAADSLSMSDKLGVTFADFTSRELPLQSAMCSFDCAQVLAEWIATVQERVGKYLGVLGRDEIDFTNVPAIMLLEEEDVKLLAKCEEILRSAGIKMNWEMQNGEIRGLGHAQAAGAEMLRDMEQLGFGSKILRVTAYMLDKSACWPVTHLMATCLEVQANHMRARSENSVLRRN